MLCPVTSPTAQSVRRVPIDCSSLWPLTRTKNNTYGDSKREYWQLGLVQEAQNIKLFCQSSTGHWQSSLTNPQGLKHQPSHKYACMHTTEANSSFWASKSPRPNFLWGPHLCLWICTGHLVNDPFIPLSTSRSPCLFGEMSIYTPLWETGY